MGRSSARARASASSPHGYQSTGFSACWRRYGDVSCWSRFGIPGTLLRALPWVVMPPRDLSFFDGLLRLLALERAAAKAHFEEERARLTLAELEAKGLVALDLESVEESIGLGGRILVTFEHPERRHLRARFHPGDLVQVRPRKAEDVAPARGIVS